ncbi:MAG: IS1380 family transposase [Gammaproteobacteria bacterium]|nr:IS1380 family transposase [Gammaproteobacteria bacterium]
MNILPYNLATTNDQLTSRGGLLAIAELMQSMQLAQCIDQHFPAPKSNRGFAPSVYLQTLILMQHEGSFHLDEVRHLNEDFALRSILGLDTVPQAVSIGAWLRRQGLTNESTVAMEAVNKAVLQAALHHRKTITLDIDATEIVANKADAQWTYNKNKGYMPMVGHIAETGQVVACDFRQGNAAPAKQNLEFIQQCQKALPFGCNVGALRIDAAGYQTNIIQYCDQQGIDYAIRAKLSPSIKRHISALNEDQWTPLVKRNGNVSARQSTYTPLL